MFRVLGSDMQEVLLKRLQDVLARPAADPLAPETVLVPSDGFARWLSLEISRVAGICSNIRFLTPEAFFQRVRAEAAAPALTPDALTWRLFDALGRLPDGPAFAAPRAYLDANSEVDRFRLARRVAGLFDRYSMYRHEWIDEWDSGSGDHWQAHLWRFVTAGSTVTNRAHSLRELAASLGADRAHALVPTGRLLAIGLSHLAPAEIALLSALGRHADVQVFVLDPDSAIGGLSASLGAQGREFLASLTKIGTHVESETSKAARDPSIQVHACHNATREIEVLHDHLLALFEERAQLQPSDVVVMAPDMTSLAPHVEAVFGSPDRTSIPFTVSARGPHESNGVADAFARLLDLAFHRLEVSAILDLLTVPSIMRRFDLAEPDLETIHRWTRETRTCWGMDEKYREEIDLPPNARHTWRDGLDRMLLGFAMPTRGELLYDARLPYDDVEGIAAQALGRLQTVVEKTEKLARDLGWPPGSSHSRTPREWGSILMQALDDFFLPAGDETFAVHGLRSAIDAVVQAAGDAGFSEPVSFDVVRDAIKPRISETLRSGSALNGAVTFCSIDELRGVPFKFVCLIGMNNASFPRADRNSGDDLLQAAPKPSDHSRRASDRQAFLDSIASARECLHISYTGNDQHDNSVIPPSVVVSELLDAAALTVVRHPLQPFSRRYFTGDSGLFSYSTNLRDAAAASVNAAQLGLFFTNDLPAPPEEWRTVELNRLLWFFRSPAEFLLRERLKVYLGKDEEPPSDREPFALDPLECYKLRQELLVKEMQDAGAIQSYPLIEARGGLPHGVPGKVVFLEGAAEVAAQGSRLRDSAKGSVAVDPAAVNIELGDFRLVGVLQDLRDIGLLDWRPADPKAKDRVRLWIRHLVLCAIRPRGVSCQSRWIGKTNEFAFKEVEDATGHLEELLKCYWEALRLPLRFIPECSFAYATAMAKEKPEEEAMMAAREEWTSSQYYTGPSDDPYVQLAYRGVDPFDEDFARIARKICDPMIQYSDD